MAGTSTSTVCTRFDLQTCEHEQGCSRGPWSAHVHMHHTIRASKPSLHAGSRAYNNGAKQAR